MGWFSRTITEPVPDPRVAALEAEVAALRVRLDDLEDATARRLGRLDKRSGLDAAGRDDRPAAPPKAAPTDRQQLHLALQRHLTLARGG